ncbi:MAG: ABC transporter permease [Candidatus Acidiferrales bacterium]|jgi:predicted permease
MSFWQNLRYTFRVLGKNPSFTIVAVLSLALGIGANTAIFTLINALLLRSLPVRQPDRLVEVSSVRIRLDDKVPFSYRMFRELERGQRVFTGLIGVDLGYQWHAGKMLNVEANGVLSQNHLLWVTGNFYSELGVAPALGRLFTAQDADPANGAASEVAVISYEFWQRRLGGASDVVGKQIRVEGHPFTIVGVTQKWFTGLTRGEPPEITLPITAAPLIEDEDSSLDRGGAYWLFVIGRLKDGVSIEQARAQLQSIWPEVLRTTADNRQGSRLQAYLSLRVDVSSAEVGVVEGLRSQFTRPLALLTGLAGLTLLVACLNLANLMLAHATARSHEMSVRAVLGASRWSLVRQVLIESLTLSLTGALLGLAFAYWACRLLLLLITRGNPMLVALDLSPDWRVLCFTMFLALLTGILFGIVPAWRCSLLNPAAALQGTHNLAERTGKLGKILVCSQVAFSLVLLLGAGLLAKTLEKLRSSDLGFQTDKVLEVSLYPKPGGYQDFDMNAYHSELLERVASIPGVISAGYSNNSIVGGRESGWQDDVSPESGGGAVAVKVRSYGTMISPDFFRTLEIPLIRGRDFNQTDDATHPRVAIVSSSLAKRLFPNGDAIGKRIRIVVNRNVEIVGVAGDARIFDLRDAAAPVIYFSCLQIPPKWGGLVVRTKEPPEELANTVGHEIESLGREYPFWTGTIAELMSQQLAKERVTALLSGFFALLALLLACIGLYGLMSYTVTRRTREIGIRVALGAQRTAVLWIVLRETLVLALVGIAIGIPSALLSTRLIDSMLFGLSPGDLPTITSASLLLLLVALFAGFLPAWRASAVDPAVALRAE